MTTPLDIPITSPKNGDKPLAAGTNTDDIRETNKEPEKVEINIPECSLPNSKRRRNERCDSGDEDENEEDLPRPKRLHHDGYDLDKDKDEEVKELDNSLGYQYWKNFLIDQDIRQRNDAEKPEVVILPESLINDSPLSEDESTDFLTSYPRKYTTSNEFDDILSDDSEWDAISSKIPRNHGEKDVPNLGIKSLPSDHIPPPGIKVKPNPLIKNGGKW